MKAPCKVLISILALGLMAAGSFSRAADEKAPAAEAPRAGKAGKGGKAGRGGAMAEDRITAIEKAVGTLTADQKAKIKDIYAKMAEEMQAARGAGAGGDRQAARAKMEQLTKSTHDQIRALLTDDDQKAKFDAMPAMPRGGGGGGAKGGKKKAP